MRIRTLIFSVLVLGATECWSQRNTLDSLDRVFSHIPGDTNKVLLLIRTTESLREKDNNGALVYAQRATALADSLQYPRGQVSALENLGWIFYRKGDYSKSLDVSTRALSISRQLGDDGMEAKCLINIAAIYYEQKQFDQAIDQFKAAFEVAERLGDWYLMSRCYNNIAYTYVGLGKIDSAYTYARKALSASNVSGDKYMLAFAMRTLGDIDLLKGDHEEALNHFNDCLELSLTEGNTFLRASVLHRLGKTHNHLGNTAKAINYLNENISIAEKYGFKDELERAYKMAAEIFYARNELEKAYQYQSKYIELHDSLYNQRSGEQIALMQIRFDTEMKQAQIELLTKQDEIKAGEIERQRGWIYFYVACLALFVVLAFVLFFYSRRNRRANILLQEKNREIQRQTRQLMNVNATKDKLFSIISHDLRSPVASLKSLMELIEKAGVTQEEFKNLTGALKRNLDSVYEDLDNLLLWAQTQLNGLQAIPEEVNVRHLAEEKVFLFREVAQRKAITIVNSIQHDVVAIADRNHLGIILRNLLANAIKFNHPGGRITLDAMPRHDCYEISITDSGVGMNGDDIKRLFNAETHFTRPGTQKEKGAGLGLLLTKEFIETNHGRIWVTSQLDRGTTFTFTLRAARVPALA